MSGSPDPTVNGAHGNDATRHRRIRARVRALGLTGPWRRQPHKSHQGEERRPAPPRSTTTENDVLEIHRDAISRQVEAAKEPAVQSDDSGGVATV